ncbi:MAG: hypothetical protein GX417_07910 [Clostridiales bacterium]|nr:hypothetical protein [Clostridiales bacterium]
MNAKQKTTLTKIFSLAGTILVWGPILFMFLTAIVGSIMDKRLLFDYLMLAELFPIVALGLALLILAGLLSRTFAKWFGWGAAAAVAALAGGQILATASGLASGALAQSGLVFAIVIAAIVIFNVIVIALAIIGIALVKRVFAKAPPSAVPAE